MPSRKGQKKKLFIDFAISYLSKKRRATTREIVSEFNRTHSAKWSVTDREGANYLRQYTQIFRCIHRAFRPNLWELIDREGGMKSD